MGNIPIFDAHYDIFHTQYDEEGKAFDDSYYALNYEEMLRNRPMIRGLATYVSPKYANRGFERANFILDKFYEEYLEKQNDIKIIKTSDDMKNVINKKKLGVLLSIENGSAIQGNLDNIDHFYNRGIRMMGITWNADNDLGCGVRTENDTGLTDLGKAYIKKLNEMNIAIDVSHASPKTIDDVLDISNAPIIASHSCADALCPHVRNLTDEQIRRISEKGGIIGVTFYGPFLTENPKANIKDVIKHINYIAKIAGTNRVGLGSDFQLFEPKETPKGLTNLDDFDTLFYNMKNSGYPDSFVERVAGRNMIDYFGRVLEKELIKEDEKDR